MLTTMKMKEMLLIKNCCLLFTLFILSSLGDYSWPQAWYGNWTQYSIPHGPMPPYPHGIPEPPFTAGRGQVYYDYNKMSMTEIYVDECVPLFSFGNKFQCQFLSTKGSTYLITFEDRPKEMEPCCIFNMDIYPPPPDFIKRANISYDSTTDMNDRLVDWYVLAMQDDDILLHFGYGFYQDTQNPAQFWFDGVQGWVTQSYTRFIRSAPPSSIFNIPDNCMNAPKCEFFKKSNIPTLLSSSMLFKK